MIVLLFQVADWLASSAVFLTWCESAILAAHLLTVAGTDMIATYNTNTNKEAIKSMDRMYYLYIAVTRIAET